MPREQHATGDLLAPRCRDCGNRRCTCPTFLLPVLITARDRDAAEALREEIVGAVEDNTESHEIAAHADVGDLVENVSSEDIHWGNDAIQFPRLLAELAGVLDTDDYVAVARHMDLTPGDVTSVFERAEIAWTAIKAQTKGGR